jgi:hypothetical protein
MWEGSAETEYQNDRRKNPRFSFMEEVRYKTVAEQRICQTGVGKMANISSGGVCFTTQHILAVGVSVELSINWPVLLNGSCRMRLIIYGHVIRTGKGTVAVAIHRHEFRTQGSGNRQ